LRLVVASACAFCSAARPETVSPLSQAVIVAHGNAPLSHGAVRVAARNFHKDVTRLLLEGMQGSDGPVKGRFCRLGTGAREMDGAKFPSRELGVGALAAEDGGAQKKRRAPSGHRAHPSSATECPEYERDRASQWSRAGGKCALEGNCRFEHTETSSVLQVYSRVPRR